MTHQFGVLDEQLIHELKKMNEKDCETAISIIGERLQFLRSPDYYLRVSVEDLGLSTRAYLALKINKLGTVKDIIEVGWDSIGRLQNVGQKTLTEIHHKMNWVMANKNRIIGKAGIQLLALMKDTPNTL